MIYWVSFSKVGIGEVLRERSYDSIVKARRYAVSVLKGKEYNWAGIHKSKDTRYHTEIIDYYPAMGVFLASKYDGKRRFANYPIRPDGTLGKKLS